MQVARSGRSHAPVALQSSGRRTLIRLALLVAAAALLAETLPPGAQVLAVRRSDAPLEQSKAGNRLRRRDEGVAPAPEDAEDSTVAQDDEEPFPGDELPADNESVSPQTANNNSAAAAAASEQIQCDTYEDILATRPSRPVGILFGISYSIIFVFGLAGNIITLYVLVLKGSKCAVQDILIANLACSDIMLCLFAVPITPKYLIRDGHWTMGFTLCKVVSFAQSTSVYMSTYSLICIGYIRYRLIVYPLGESMSKRTALLSCLGTWLVGVMVTLPYMLQVRLSPDNCAIKFCDEAWENPYRFIFSLFTATFQFVIPLASVAFFNKKIYSRLDGRLDSKKLAAGASCCGVGIVGGATPSTTTTTTGAAVEQQLQANALTIKLQRQREKERRMRKANNRLIFVVVIFAHSWLPLNLFNLAQDYFESISTWPYQTNTFLIAHQIACSSVCWNPILYAWMSESYRQDLRRALPQLLADRFKCLKLDAPSAASTAAAAPAHHQLSSAGGGGGYAISQLGHHVAPASGRAKLAQPLAPPVYDEEEEEEDVAGAAAKLELV